MMIKSYSYIKKIIERTLLIFVNNLTKIECVNIIDNGLFKFLNEFGMLTK